MSRGPASPDWELPRASRRGGTGEGAVELHGRRGREGDEELVAGTEDVLGLDRGVVGRAARGDRGGIERPRRRLLLAPRPNSHDQAAVLRPWSWHFDRLPRSGRFTHNRAMRASRSRPSPSGGPFRPFRSGSQRSQTRATVLAILTLNCPVAALPREAFRRRGCGRAARPRAPPFAAAGSRRCRRTAAPRGSARRRTAHGAPRR